ncbi:MAG: nitroreductase family protein [Actinomycetia bacterium]|nr:nitroreductase family protein [Actinomycetes bacterium]MCP4222874.1 nitroreductase family protein [Actinomycetes bacterium]MCP5034346.1 nitroreductase family protein [Actinomycetes bacterium]
MELVTALTRRRMVRAFEPTPLPSDELDDVLDQARRAPSAGNTQAIGFVVLDSPDATALYWDTTLPGERRTGFRWQGLLDAPALVLVTVEPEAYVARYGERDKAATGLGASEEAWVVPYWWVDAGAVVQNLLLLAVDRAWGACLFGPFDHEPALRQALGVGESTRLVATVALGLALPDEPGRSVDRARPALSDVITRPLAGRRGAGPAPGEEAR